jgi:hypothetical protein
MSSEIKADKWSPASGTSATIGDSGDTYTVPTGANFTVTDEVKTNKISPASGTSFTLGDSGDTFTVPSGVTFANSGTATGFGGDNTPYFHVYLSSNQSVSSMATTKVNFNTEVYDTANAYDNSSNYRYTPTTAGFYKFYIGVTYYADADNLEFIFAKIKMNGSTVIATGDVDMRFARGRRMTAVAQCIQQMNGSSDYVEVFAFVASDGSTNQFVGDSDKSTYFGGYKLIT